MKSNDPIQLAKEIDEIFYAEDHSETSPGNSYIAVTPAGEVGITISDQASAKVSATPIQRRLELGRYEQAIRLLEDWLNLPLDFVFTEKQFSAPAIFSVTSALKPSAKISVHLPLALWLIGDQSVAVLETSALEIEWKEFYAKVIIDQLTLSAKDKGAVKAGSTVLLASSFNSNWSPRLSVPALELAVVGGVDMSGLSWTENNAVNHIEYTSTTFGDETIGEVICYCSVTGKMFVDKTYGDLQELLTNKLRNHQWSLQFTGDKKAVGELLPIANGIGLHIKQVVDCH